MAATKDSFGFEVEGKSILQHLQSFEERQELQWVAAAERARKHEQWMEAWAADLVEKLKKHSFVPAVIDEKEAEDEKDDEFERESFKIVASQQGSISCDGDHQKASERNGGGEEDLEQQTSSVRRGRSMPVESYAPSGAGDLHKVKRTVSHARTHLENLQQAKENKLRKMQNLQQGAQQQVGKKIEKEKEKVKQLRQQSQEFVSREAKDRKKKQKSPLKRFVKSHRFDAFFGLMILSSAFLTGFETEYQAKHLDSEVPLVFDLLNLIFCWVFFVELILRLLAERGKFLLGKDWSWNLFDLTVVSSSVIEELLKWTRQSSAANHNLMTVRVLRLLRLVRMTRVVRALRFLHELRVMVLSILGSFRPLLWTCCLLTLLLFVNGVYITQMVNDYRSDPNNTAWLAELEYYYGSVLFAVYSLFQCSSGGTDWGDVSEPLTAISPWFLPYFCVLVAVVVFTFLNVVTGIFVDHALKTAESDRDFIIQEEMARRHAYAAEVEVVFREADSNGDGLLSFEELATHFNDERVGAWLAALGIDSIAGHALFDLLDEEGHGFVDISEFVQGCFRLKGSARSIDIAMLQFEQRKLLHDLRHLVKTCEARTLETLRRLTAQVLRNDSKNGNAKKVEVRHLPAQEIPVDLMRNWSRDSRKELDSEDVGVIDMASFATEPQNVVSTSDQERQRQMLACWPSSYDSCCQSSQKISVKDVSPDMQNAATSSSQSELPPAPQITQPVFSLPPDGQISLPPGTDDSTNAIKRYATL